MARVIHRNSRHIRWNWEKSPDVLESVRYHFVIVDDKGRARIKDEILGQIQRVRSGIGVVREVEGRVKGSRLNYLFLSFDTPVALRELHLGTLGKTY
ncbi:hypothetical protein ACFL0X_03070 [Nanoarchaeota archaeon]